MIPTRIALIADVHGNLHALDVVLKDIQRREVATIINLGDSLHGLLNPLEVAERLMALNIVSLSGNEDRIIVEPDERERASQDYAFLMAQLQDGHLRWLRDMPKTYVLGDVFCCHGTPQQDNLYLLEKVTPHGVLLRETTEIEAYLENIPSPVIACAHSHIARLVYLPDGRLIVNPGSVGIPAYDDDVPYPHKMEAGSPHARYAILTRDAADWSAEFVALAYDWHQPAELARQRGRADRAHWIETGRV
jgi:predicted phosphodiesterase